MTKKYKYFGVIKYTFGYFCDGITVSLCHRLHSCSPKTIQVYTTDCISLHTDYIRSVPNMIDCTSVHRIYKCSQTERVYTTDQCWGSMIFWCGFGSADPCLWLMDPDPDPVIFIIDLLGTFTLCFKGKVKQKLQNSRNQGFSYFCLLMEGPDPYK